MKNRDNAKLCILAGENDRGLERGRFKGGKVASVANYSFHTPFFQLFNLFRVDITSNSPDLKGLKELGVCQHVVNNGASLSAGGAEYSEYFGHGRCCMYESDSGHSDNNGSDKATERHFVDADSLWRSGDYFKDWQRWKS